ncbi:11010_t:CDS:2, partial [Gigaspora margarita]
IGLIQEEQHSLLITSEELTNIILEDFVNLRDPIFRDRKVTQFEFSTEIAESNIEDNIDMDFNPEDLFNTVFKS